MRKIYTRLKLVIYDDSLNVNKDPNVVTVKDTAAYSYIIRLVYKSNRKKEYKVYKKEKFQKDGWSRYLYLTVDTTEELIVYYDIYLEGERVHYDVRAKSYPKDDIKQDWSVFYKNPSPSKPLTNLNRTLTPTTKQGSSTTNKVNNSSVQLKSETPRWYYRPETGELIYIETHEEAVKITNEANEFAKLIENIQKNNKLFEDAVKAYEKACEGTCNNPVDKGNHATKADQYQEQLKKDAEALKKALNKAGISSVPKSGKSLIELIPLDPKKQRSKDAGLRKFTYVPKTKTGARAHWKSYKLNDKEKGGNDNFLKTENGKTRIDSEKLKEQVKKANLKFKFSANTAPFAGDLFDWAEEWNKSLTGSTSYGSIDLGGQAQFMRYSAGAGAAVEFNPAKGTLLAKADANASFAIAQGSGTAVWHVPNRLGFRLAYGVVDMGRVRAILSITVSGFVGASVAVEVGVEVKPSSKDPNKNIIVGAPPKQISSFKGQRSLDKYTDKAAFDASADVFAGASANANFTGAVQWQEPQLNGNKVDFAELVKIIPQVAVQAGAGAAAAFHIGYEGGKLRGYVKAGLCWGVGAKGSMGIEVNVKTILSFCYWIFYQYYRVGSMIIGDKENSSALINSKAWKFISELQVVAMSLNAVKLATYLMENEQNFKLRVQKVIDGYKNVAAKAPQRNNLAVNLGKRPKELLIATPRAKGFYLYELTRHGTGTGTDYSTRAKAIFAVLYSIQTKTEWTQVFARVRPLDESAGGATPNREAVQRFLREELGYSVSEAKKVETIGAALTDTLGFKPVWRDKPDQVALAYEQWDRYQSHEGMLAGVSRFDLSKPFDQDQDTYLT